MADPSGHDHGHRHHLDPAALIPLERYRSELLARLAPLDPIELALLEAQGCVLAEDVTASADVPGFANSAMDGYAVAAAEAEEGSELVVAGEVAAGAAPGVRAGDGAAVRIMTGAPLPPGADAVVPVEVADEAGGRVRFRAAARPGEHVRGAGEDVRAGETVLESGRRLRAADIGMLAAVGRASVRVHPRPRVAVVATGDELVDPAVDPGPLPPGHIRDSNSYTLTALVREAGAVAYRHAVVPDDRTALVEAIEGALVNADLLVTSGGVSAGRYDLVKQVLADLGDVRAVKVGMQPGMPQAFGFVASLDRPVPCFGLPGNPVSSYVSFEIFVRPALRRLQGRTDLNRPRISATLAEPISSPEHRVSFLRVTLHRDDDGGWQARPTGAQGSGILRSVVAADGLAEVPADRTHLDTGDRVVVHLLVEPS